MIWILIFLVVLIIYLVFVKKLHIDFKSFFKRGFKKIDNAFRRVLFHAESNGKGKTLSSVRFLIDYKNKYPNSRIITNVNSFDIYNDTIHLTNFNDIMTYCINNYHKPLGKRENLIIFYDEIFTLLEKNKALSKDILSFLSQLRKRQIILITTAQEWLEINITFRRYIRYQIDCNMISLPLIKTAICINCINDGDLITWDNNINEYVAPRVQTNIFKGNKSIIDAYDTFETITTHS